MHRQTDQKMQYDMKQIQMPVEIPATFKIWHSKCNSNASRAKYTKPTRQRKNLETFYECIMNLNSYRKCNDNFTDGSALSDPGPVGASLKTKDQKAHQ